MMLCHTYFSVHSHPSCVCYRCHASFFFFSFFFFKSCFMQSIHLFAGLPFGLLPSSLASRKCLLLIRYLSCDQWRSKDVRGPWTTDSLGPLPILQNFIPLTPLPYTPQLRLCTRLYLYTILNTTHQYTSHGVFWKFESLMTR